jgi:NADPH-dependent 2,4-dienoyl-CoA reductase/sulfur reductase-like enzyme
VTTSSIIDLLIGSGTMPEDAIEIARLLEPQIDFLDVSVGSYYRGYKMVSTMEDPLGYELPKTTQVTRAVDVPTIVTGRIMTLDHAEQILADGMADMVSMVRATIADPNLVRKSREGRAAEVRPCTGTSEGCVGKENNHFGCVVNVSAGWESTISVEVSGTAAAQRRVMIVGAGPAGLEAARTAALRGHEVLIYEMTNKLGGQTAIAGAAPHRGDAAAITRYLGDELERLGVKVTMRTFVDPDLVEEVKPDVLIVAAGATPRRDGFLATRPASVLKGFDLPHVYTSWDVFGFGGRAKIGKHAVVFDDTGTFEGLSVCEQLLEQGADVTAVTPHPQIGARVKARFVLDMAAGSTMERLSENPSFRVIHSSHLLEITPTDVEVGGALGRSKRTTRVPADTVVLIGFNTPNRNLADAFANSGLEVHVIGDADGGRSFRGALRAAALLTRGL